MTAWIRHSWGSRSVQEPAEQRGFARADPTPQNLIHDQENQRRSVTPGSPPPRPAARSPTFWTRSRPGTVCPSSRTRRLREEFPGRLGAAAHPTAGFSCATSPAILDEDFGEDLDVIAGEVVEERPTGLRSTRRALSRPRRASPPRSGPSRQR